MTVYQKVQQARRILLSTAALAALLWGAAAGLATFILAGLIHLAAPLPSEALSALWPTAILVALSVSTIFLRRWRAVRSLERVALWIEERQPELRFTLVTAIDPTIAPEERYPELHAS